MPSYAVTQPRRKGLGTGVFDLSVDFFTVWQPREQIFTVSRVPACSTVSPALKFRGKFPSICSTTQDSQDLPSRVLIPNNFFLNTF